VKNWDVIVIGGGIIGLSISLQLRKHGARVLVVERTECGLEASYAAGGMLADCTVETPAALRPLATVSANLYPNFVEEVQTDSGINVDLRDYGTILFLAPEHEKHHPEFVSAHSLPEAVGQLEAALAPSTLSAFYLKERSVDPRTLTHAVLATARRRGVDISSGEEVLAVDVSAGCVTGVSTRKTSFHASKVVNCAGAWSGQIAPCAFPTRPVKGQMLCLLSPRREVLKHVVRTPEVYLIPRSDGRIVVGSTLEEAGFDKRTDVSTIQRLRKAAIAIIPELQNAKILQDWAGLRPGTPDSLPILGATRTPGYYVATGHFRDGILLAPITAQIMADVIAGRSPEHALDAFSPFRFSSQRSPAA
jgi:glycine oxidase